MGKINEYQRKQLVSSVSGVSSQDVSGAIIGGALEGIGEALSQRQVVLDNAAAATAYYQYAAASSLGVMELRKQYQTDSNLDPLTFDAKFQEAAINLSINFKEKLPERLHNKFDLLVSRGNAQQTVSNSKWAFNQQNRNALSDFQELNTQATVIAGNFMNSEDYIGGREIYLETAKTYQSVMTPKSFSSTTKAALKQQARTYWNNSIDYRNGGDPAAFATALETDKKFRETLQQDLGTREFKRLEIRLGTFTKQMGLDMRFRKLVADNEELSVKVKKLYDPTNDYGLKQVSNELEKEINQRNYMTAINNKGQYDGTITQAETNIKNLQLLKKLAGNVNDASYSSDPAKKAELVTEIRVGMSPYGTDAFEKKLAKVKANVASQISKREIKYPWHSVLNPAINVERGIRLVRERVTGISEKARREADEDVRANKNISQYIETAQTLKGRILQAIDTQQLTYKDGLQLFSQIGMLDDVNAYDSLVSQKQNWFTQGYDAFNDYARNLDLFRGTVEINRRLRDDIKTQMMDEYTKRVASLGDIVLTPVKRAQIIGAIKQEKSQQLRPEFMGVQPGEYVSVRGQSVKFLGYSNNTGKILIENPNLQKEVDNL